MVSSPRQIPLDLGSTTGLTRDDLVVSVSNAAAVAFIDGWTSAPPLIAVLVGPPGSGKSHLATIWREQVGAAEVDRQKIGSEEASLMAQGGIVIDDADGSGLDETGLFHLLNEARASSNPVLLTARRFPSAWGVKLADLASRLGTATRVELQEPDDALLAGVITKLFADRQVEVEAQVVQFLVRRIERSVATAISVVDRLDRRALEAKSRITRQMAAGVLEAMDAGQRDLGF